VAPGFHVLAISPGPKSELWNYISVGGVLVTKTDRPPTEFLVIAEDNSPEYVERLAMTVYYHHTETLGVGHTFPIGEPWVTGSTLGHALVSRPYPHGPSLEEFSLGVEQYGHILWILPITLDEREFAKQRGLEALEERFEQAGLRYWDVERDSVV